MPDVVRDALLVLAATIVYILIHSLRREDRRRQARLEMELAEAKAKIESIENQNEEHDFLVAEAQRLVDRVMKLETRQENRHEKLNDMQARLTKLEVTLAFCTSHRRILTNALDKANKKLAEDGFEPVMVDLPLLPEAADEDEWGPPTRPLRPGPEAPG